MRAEPLRLVFFATEVGNEPVRVWLKSRPKAERRAIGEDVKTVQRGWPLGMPLVRSLKRGLHEVRTRLPDRIVRVTFGVDDGVMVLLHAFVKKARTEADDIALARKRLAQWRRP